MPIWSIQNVCWNMVTYSFVCVCVCVFRRCICWRISFTIGSGEAHWGMCESWQLCSKRYHPKVWLHIPREAWFSLSDLSDYVAVMKFWLLGSLLLYVDRCTTLTGLGFLYPPARENEEEVSVERNRNLSCIVVLLGHRFLFLQSLLCFYFCHWIYKLCLHYMILLTA